MGKVESTLPFVQISERLSGFNCEYQKGSSEVAALAAAHPNLRISRIGVSAEKLEQLKKSDADWEIVNVHLHVSGPSLDLIAGGFMHPDWLKLPPCGVKHCFTIGFGGATVKRLKNGNFHLSWLNRHNMLDLLAPALLPLYFSPARPLRS